MSISPSSQVLDAVATYWRDSSELGDDARHVRRKSQQQLVRRYHSSRHRVLRVSMIFTVLLGLLVVLQLFTAFSIESLVHIPASVLRLNAWKSSQEGLFDTMLCPSCNQTSDASATQSGIYATAEDFSSVPLGSPEDVRHKRASIAAKKRYLLHHIVLMSIMEKTWMNPESTTGIFKNYFSRPDSLLTFSFDGLDLDKPTTYLYTRTGPGGKLHDINRRVHHLKRHGDTLVQFQELVKQEGYFDGEPQRSRQIIWVVIEDDATIDLRVAAYLESIGQRKYVPFSVGAHI